MTEMLCTPGQAVSIESWSQNSHRQKIYGWAGVMSGGSAPWAGQEVARLKERAAAGEARAFHLQRQLEGVVAAGGFSAHGNGSAAPPGATSARMALVRGPPSAPPPPPPPDTDPADLHLQRPALRP